MKFLLKGNRNYIQGGDIFEWVASSVEKERAGVLKTLGFKRFTMKEIFIDYEDSLPGSIVCSGTYVTCKGQEVPFSVREGEACGVLGRRPYDEDGMLASAVVSGNQISMQAPPGFSSIEVIVAMTKKLCYALQAPDAAGKWVFGFIRLAAPLPKRMGEVAIENRSILNKRFAVNRVTVDGEEVAEIRFIVGAP